jgi:hypothetical protein
MSTRIEYRDREGAQAARGVVETGFLRTLGLRQRGEVSA